MAEELVNQIPKYISMKKFLSKRIAASVYCTAFAFSLLLVCCGDRGDKDQQPRNGHTASKDPLKYVQWGMDTAENRGLSLNILLKPGTSWGHSSSAIAGIESEIAKKVYEMNHDWKPRFWIFACKCDSTLFNLAATVVDGQDHGVSPPGGVPSTGGGGDILFVSTNFKLKRDSFPSEYKFDSSRLEIHATGSSEEILAIIDTGIDTTHFSKDIRKFIWTAPPGTQVLYNFLGGAYADNDFRDDYVKKHGSGVAGVIITALQNGIFPKLMILKALDSQKKGTTFTYNCALSYAIKNHAKVVNVSLGYETKGTGDSVSYEYLRRCRDVAPNKSIYVFTAAGNIDGSGDICADGPSTNELTNSRRFYPGCFSTDFINVFNITGLTSEQKSCRFQNYSDQFVTLGVLNQTGCCKYVTQFFTFGFDGTSFATPAAAGMIMNCHLNNPLLNIPACVQSLQQTAPSPFVTKQGHYLKYNRNPPGLH